MINDQHSFCLYRRTDCATKSLILWNMVLTSFNKEVPYHDINDQQNIANYLLVTKMILTSLLKADIAVINALAHK